MSVFLIFIALLIVLSFAYKPAKKALKNFLEQKHVDIVQSLQEAEKQYNNAQDHCKKVQQDYEESVRLNEIKLVDFKVDLQEVNKEKISKLHKIVERDLEMLRTFYQKDVADLSEALVYQQMKLSINRVLQDFQNGQEQNSFMTDKLRQIN